MCAIREHGPASIKIQSDRDSRSDAMAKDTMNFAQQNSERAVQATNWMRAIAEQNLNQSKAAFEGLLTIARNAVRGVEILLCYCAHPVGCLHSSFAILLSEIHRILGHSIAP